ncbi:MAG: ABC transporter permease, partial [Planctomycetes bacterium]|nr:ABC transporter permease [Planctomycetota bacterium]
MSTLATACSIARKDLRLFFRDRTGVALGFLLPLVLVGVFGFVMKLASGGDGGMSRTSLWVVDQDMSEASRRFISELRKASTLNLKPAESAAAVDEAWVRREIADGELHHALLVPAGFAAALERRELPELTMLRDPDRELDDQLVSVGLMQAAITALGPDFAEAMTTRMLERAGLPPEWRERTVALSRAFSSGVRLLFEEKERQAPVATGDDAGAPAFDA